ncbi:ABC transporter permease [Paenibacillus yonginensis]|uniref:ABC transporter permease n=1 Tax=Paenibacillus yonginensis TaxID=1462996 RepID=A0A1B1N564_9BACL|nr:ABC transporter permease [Paenibacillus yonginensis]ANS76573.1 ABC transporter permease [Paenibacillus yonginensis]
MLSRAMTAQCRAEILRTLRNRRFVIFALLMPALFYFIFTSVVGDAMQIGGIEWKAYYLMSMTVYGVLGSSITSLSSRLAAERASGYNRLLRITPLSSSVYVASKMVSTSVINAGIILFMFLLGSLFKGVVMSWEQWLFCGLWIWAGALPFMALGTLLGQLRNTDAVQVVSQLVYMGISILGGLWFPKQAMSPVLQRIMELMPSYRFGSGAWGLAAGHGVSGSSLLTLAVYAALFVVLSSYLNKRQDAI